MAFITGIPIRDSIHSDFSTGSGVWQEYRRNLTGLFHSGGGVISGRYGEFTQDIQEYNRKIDTLTGQWNDTGLFLEPYNAGFRYTGSGDFRTWPPITSSSTTTTYSIASNTDDGNTNSSATTSTSVQYNGSISNTNNSQVFAGAQYDGEESEINYNVGYFRFTNVAIDQGATVQSAILKPIKRSIQGSASKDFQIAGIDADNQGVPSSASSLNASNQTTATVTLPKSTVSAVTDDDRFDTPDIKTIIQEIVNRAGWSSGNSIVLVVYTPTNVNSSAAVRVKFGSKAGTDQSAQLEITV